MRRLYYLTGDVNTATRVSEIMHQKGIHDWNFHIMSKNKTVLKGNRLHRANYIMHERDSLRIAERGTLFGLLLGAVLIIYTLMNSSANSSETRLIFLAMAAYTAIVLGVIGGGVGMILGLAFENIKVRRFHEQLEQGQYLLMIDTKKEDVAEIKKTMSSFKETIEAGEDTTLVVPFHLA